MTSAELARQLFAQAETILQEGSNVRSPFQTLAVQPTWRALQNDDPASHRHHQRSLVVALFPQ